MFPLLLLPILVLTKVIRNIDSFEFFNLTLCSRRSLRAIKQAIGKNKRDMKLSILSKDGRFRFDIFDPNDFSKPWSLVANPLELRDHNRTFEVNVLDVFWADPIGRFKGMLNHIFNIYNAKEIRVDLDDNTEAWVDMVKWLREKGQRVGSATLSHLPLGTDFSILLDQIPFIANVELNRLTPTEDFVQNDTRSYENNRLKIRGGDWVTLPRLLTMNCEVLHVSGTQLTSTDCNAFLKHWIRGGSPKINKLYLGVLNLDLNVALEGINFQRNDERDVSSLIDDDDPETVPRDIRSLDGKIGTVFFAAVRTGFEFQVCDS